MWSLAVEEQFYLLFPIVLLLLFRLCRKHTVAVLGVVAAFSFALSLWATTNAPVFNFYLPLTRAWELLAGSFIALGAVPEVRQRLGREILAFGGLALIIISVVAYSPSTPFPGASALLPVTGSALILLTAKDTLVGRAFSIRPLVYIGLISYPLYLIHWPAIVLFKYTQLSADPVPFSLIQSFFIVSFSVLFSALLYHFVERHFRSRQWIGRNAIFGLSLASATAVLAFCALILVQNGFPSRGGSESALLRSLKLEISDFQSNECLRRGDTLARPGACDLAASATDAAPAAAFWGDSQAAQLAPAFAAVGNREGISIRQFTKAGCPPILADRFEPSDRMVADCPAFNRAVIAEIEANPAIKVLFVAARWETYLDGHKLAVIDAKADGINGSNAAIVETIRRLQRLLRARGGELVLFGNTPIPGVDLNICIRTAEFTEKDLGQCETFAAAPAIETANAFRNRILGPVKGEGTRLSVIEPVKIYCDETLCKAIDKGQPLFMDKVHLSKTGSSKLEPYITEKLGFSPAD
ncbi:acyltransferase family protein [Qipengyuania sp. CAU 1752]